MPTETKTLLIRIAVTAASIVAAIALIIALVTPSPAGSDPAVQATSPTQTLPAATTPTLPRSEYESHDFAFEGAYLTCLSGDSMLGIDVSHHQEQIDWTQVKEAGIQFVMVRLGYRGYETGLLNEDRYVQQNLQGARDAGLLVGAYFFSQAVTVEEAEEEARFALELLGEFRLDLPLTYDWEVAARTEHVDGQTVTECAKAFCQIVEEAGFEPMVYFNTYQALLFIDLHQLTQYRWWLALYNTGRNFPCRFDMWQYTNTGSVPGIDGDVDINIMLIS